MRVLPVRAMLTGQDLTHILRSAETLEALVNDILFISKMQVCPRRDGCCVTAAQTTSFELSNSEFDVCELLEDITQLLALRWASKRVESITLLMVPEFQFLVRAVPCTAIADCSRSRPMRCGCDRC